MDDVVHALVFILAFGALFVAVIGAEAWYLHRRGKNDAYCWKETLSNLTMGFNYKIVDGIAVAVFIRLFYDWVYQFGFQYEPVHGLLSVLLIFLVSDLAFWFFHYVMHKVRWFWAVHVTHHSSERMNYSTALRQNFTLFFNGGWLFWWLPIALIGFDKNWATIAIELNLAYQFFLHTETRSPLNKLGWIFNTPSHHRVHHGNQPEQIDTNFGGVLIIWDRIFGTFVPVKDAGNIKYGLTAKQPASLNPFYLQLHEWVDMFRDFWRTKDLRVFVKNPAWQPALPASVTPDSSQEVLPSASCGRSIHAVTRLLVVIPAISILVALSAGCSDSNDEPIPHGQIEMWLTLGDESKKLYQERDLSWQAGPSADSQSITIDTTTRFQKMEGFGAAMTDSSAWLIMNRLDDNHRQKLMRDLFTREGEGIGLSYVRIPMGASDFALQSYTYNDLAPGETDPDLLYFSIAHDEEYIIPSLQLAREFNPQLRFMGSPWSPPEWMKTKYPSLEAGVLIGRQLKEEYLQAFATYHVKFVQAYGDANLPIDAVTPQNEPMHWTPFYPTMQMLPQQQQTFVRDHLGPAFREAELSTRIVILDHNWDLVDYALQVLSDDAAAEYVDGVAFHCYRGEVASQSRMHNAYPDKNIWFTECSGGRWATDFASNLSWMMRNLVIGNFRNWGNSLLLWNLALDEDDGPQNGGCDNCLGLVTIDQATGAVTFNSQYYFLGHVSKFVDPGAYRIASTIHGSPTQGNVAFLNPDGSIVLIVYADEAAVFSIDWNGQHVTFSLPSRGAATLRWPSPELLL